MNIINTSICQSKETTARSLLSILRAHSLITIRYHMFYHQLLVVELHFKNMRNAWRFFFGTGISKSGSWEVTPAQLQRRPAQCGNRKDGEYDLVSHVVNSPGRVPQLWPAAVAAPGPGPAFPEVCKADSPMLPDSRNSSSPFLPTFPSSVTLCSFIWKGAKAGIVF